MDLRQWLKNTLLIPEDTKSKLLKLPTWSESIEKILQEIYEKYAQKEQKILKQVYLNKERWYIKAVNKIEQMAEKKELQVIKSLEEKIKSL